MAKKFEDILAESTKRLKAMVPHQKPKTLTKFLQDKHMERSRNSATAVRKPNYEKSLDTKKMEAEQRRDLKPITR